MLKEKNEERLLRLVVYQEVQRAFADHTKDDKSNKTDDGDEYLSIDDVAKMLCVKRDTVKKMNVQRRIPFDKPNKFPRYKRSDVLAYMKRIHVKSMAEIEDDAEDYQLIPLGIGKSKQ